MLHSLAVIHFKCALNSGESQAPGQVPNCRFGSNPVGHRANKSREVGISSGNQALTRRAFIGTNPLSLAANFLLARHPPGIVKHS
jgi:hypothetical protein